MGCLTAASPFSIASRRRVPGGQVLGDGEGLEGLDDVGLKLWLGEEGPRADSRSFHRRLQR